MSRSHKPSPMLARSSEGGYFKSPETSDDITFRRIHRGSETRSSAGRGPDDVLRQLRDLVEDGQIGAARQLLAEAVRRFPDHSEIRRASRILAEGKPTPNPFAQPTSAAESEWLDDPPPEARGKWVALVGRELVAMADSVEELMETVKSKNLRQLPLVHHLAS